MTRRSRWAIPSSSTSVPHPEAVANNSQTAGRQSAAPVSVPPSTQPSAVRLYPYVYRIRHARQQGLTCETVSQVFARGSTGVLLVERRPCDTACLGEGATTASINWAASRTRYSPSTGLPVAELRRISSDQLSRACDQQTAAAIYCMQGLHSFR